MDSAVKNKHFFAFIMNNSFGRRVRIIMSGEIVSRYCERIQVNEVKKLLNSEFFINLYDEIYDELFFNFR